MRLKKCSFIWSGVELYANLRSQSLVGHQRPSFHHAFVLSIECCSINTKFIANNVAIQLLNIYLLPFTKIGFGGKKSQPRFNMEARVQSAFVFAVFALGSALFNVITVQGVNEGLDDWQTEALVVGVGYKYGMLLAEDMCAKSSLCSDPMEAKSKVLPKWEDSNCRCDDACTMFGDCCLNAKTYDPEQARIAAHHWKCIGLEGFGPYGQYMLTTCPATWSDPEIRASCERGQISGEDYRSTTPRDPLAMLPVTSRKTTFTYQNYYCAVCNEDEDGIIFWIPSVECPTLQQSNTLANVSNNFVWSNLQYDQQAESWGIYLNNLTNLPSQSTDSSFAQCHVLVKMPDEVADMVRQCRPWVDDCPPDYNNVTIRNACHSYTATVYGSGSPINAYRNVHCALCNGEELKLLSCQGQLKYRNVIPGVFSFAFLFDINENSGQLVGTTWRCTVKGEIYDPFFKKCRQLVCFGPQFKVHRGRCVLTETVTSSTQSTTTTSNQLPSTVAVTKFQSAHFTTLSSSLGKNGGKDVLVTTGYSTSTQITSTRGANPTDCPRFNITKTPYYIFKNGSIYIEAYGQLFTPDDYITAADGSVLICIPFSVDQANYLYRRKFSSALAYITLACLGVSLTCISFHLVAFVLVPPLRNLSGKNLASLCVSLVAAYLTFILSQFDTAMPRRACTSIAVILYYSFLASFFWMNCIAFDVWRTLRMATSELRVSSGQQWHKFVAYSAYSWFGPAIVVAISIIVENSSTVPTMFRPLFGQVTCWFGSRRALLIFFVAPVLTIVVLNAFMFACSACIIVGTTQSSPIHQPRSKSKRNFKLYLRLALIMGLSWIFGIVAGQVDIEPLWYVFVLLNALQGLFIFLSFTCTEKVRVYIRDKVLLKKSSYYSSTRGTRSTRKFELEGRDSGSGESQTSQTSRLSISRSGESRKGVEN